MTMILNLLMSYKIRASGEEADMSFHMHYGFFSRCLFKKLFFSSSFSNGSAILLLLIIINDKAKNIDIMMIIPLPVKMNKPLL